MTDNYYHILGLDKHASQEEIKNAYRKLAKECHPDRNPGQPEYEEKFKRVSKAYQVLSDPKQRVKFDLLLEYQQVNKHQHGPHYSPRTAYYSTESRKYTPAAWMYGKIFIIGFIMAVILIPLALFYQSSVRAYERGMDAYAEGNNSEALYNFNNAIILFGGRSAEAAIKASEISIYKVRNYKQALYFIDRGLEYAEKQPQIAYLQYLKAIAAKSQRNYDVALKALTASDSLNYSADSIHLQLALIYAFDMLRFSEAEEHLQYMIDHKVHPQTAWFGKGWCQQNQGDYKKAIESYSQVLLLNPRHAVAYYYRGMNEISLSDSLSACQDFAEAMSLGYERAASRYRYHCTEEK